MRAQRVEPDRLAERLRRGDREERRDSEGAEVEPLEDDGAGGDRAGRREAKGADGVGELCSGVRWLGLAGVELSGELEDAEPVDVASELGWHQAERLGPEPESSPGTTERTRMSPPSSTVDPAERPINGAIAA